MSNTEFTIALYNFGPGNTNAKVTDLSVLAKSADIIACQEGGDQQPAIREFLRMNRAWAQWYGRLTPGSKKIVVLYRRSVFKRGRARAFICWRGLRWVGPKGAGPTRIQAKALNRVPLQHRATGIWVVILNQHLVASATRNDLSPKEKRARLEVYREQIALLVSKTPRKRIGIATGDFNAEPKFGLLDPVWQRYFRANSGPTHGDRFIDFIMHVKWARYLITPVRTWNIKLSSDHRASFVTYRLTP